MTLEQQVISLDLAKKLKELGVKQDAFWSWYETSDRDDTPRLNRSDEHCPVCTLPQQSFEEKFSAFTVAELGEMLLPEQPNFPIKFKGKWATIVGNFEAIYDDAEANARAKMLIYLLKNKLIQP
jgi:hypothetical protein